MQTPTTQPPQAGRRPWQRLRRFLLQALILTAVGAGAVVGYYAHLASQYDMGELVAEWHPDMLESESAVKSPSPRGSRSVLAAAPADELPTLPRVALRYAGAVAYEDISESFRLAIVAREDRRFDKHFGVDPRGILRAAKRNLSSWAIKEGGSTITQQLTRTVYRLRGRSLHRKLLEAMLALRVERHYSKKEILTQYANRIYFGDGHWGIAAAARAYFDKQPKELSLAESAILAGLIRSPNRIGPTRDMTACRLHRDQVLSALGDLGWVPKEQLEAAKLTPIPHELRGANGDSSDPSRE